jgi:hypothetical protein
VRVLYHRLREPFPDFRLEIHWQAVDGDLVTTYKTYLSRQPDAQFSSKPSMRCVSAAVASSSTGA